MAFKLSRTQITRFQFMLIIALCISDTHAYIDKNISVPLRYNYLPGEPYWAKFGTIDARPISLWIGQMQNSMLGRFYIDDNNSRYTVTTDDNCKDYFDKGFFQVLSHYGVTFSSSTVWRCAIPYYSISVKSLDDDEDGERFCRITMWLTLSDGKTEYCNALVENEGSDDVDDEVPTDYSDLIDRTLHGALVKIWASQVLYTDKVLGTGTISKLSNGVYGFVPVDSLVPPHESKLSVSADQKRKDSFRRNGTTKISGPIDTLIGFTDYDTVMTGNGKRISLGILPFENATGREDLGNAVKGAQEIFRATLSEAATIRLLERERLTDILKEQALGLSGIINDSTAVKVGNITGLQVLSSVSITISGGYYRINARIINVESSRVVVTASVLVPDVTALEDGAAECAQQLLFKFTEEKIAINRNSMPYPSILPRAIPAVTASVDDAWAIGYNPAALMKVQQRDVVFFLTGTEFVKGKINGLHFSTNQPIWSDIGIYASVPAGTRFASGFGIRHHYNYPLVDATINNSSYNVKEEETVFTVPLAIGFSPQFSLGLNLNAHIGEYQISFPGVSLVEGNPVSLDATVGVLWKFSPRFRIGLTYSTDDLYEKTREQLKHDTGTSLIVDRPRPHNFRFGTAMYPVKWFFLFADLEYEKYPEATQTQPGFHLGIQLTKYGKGRLTPFLPQYSMIPVYFGYSHQPYNRITNTQLRYLSLGTGFYLNNIHLQWAFRKNIGSKSKRTIVAGSENFSVQVNEFSYNAPFYFSIGYRF